MSSRIAVLLLAVCGCGGSPIAPNAQAQLALPLVAPQPSANPSTPEKISLGRALFWDPILSGTRDVACATCHHPDFAYADGRGVSVGVGGTRLGPVRRPDPAAPHRTSRNAMTVLNTAFNGTDAARAPMFWDNRALSLETQALGPLHALDEMRGASYGENEIVPEVLTRLSAIPAYQTMFAAAFGPDSISEANLANAIASFERTLIDHDSSYDRYMKGDASAMNDAQLRGMQVFQNNGCAQCHSGPMFSDFQLHRVGVAQPAGLPADPGNGAGLFRTASLRNVTRTPPFMHNGSLATLDAVFRFYDRINRRQDNDLRNLQAPEGRDATDVKAFLEAISDGAFDRTIPEEVPSGLEPGGAIH